MNHEPDDSSRNEFRRDKISSRKTDSAGNYASGANVRVSILEEEEKNWKRGEKTQKGWRKIKGTKRMMETLSLRRNVPIGWKPRRGPVIKVNELKMFLTHHGLYDVACTLSRAKYSPSDRLSLFRAPTFSPLSPLPPNTTFLDLCENPRP